MKIRVQKMVMVNATLLNTDNVPLWMGKINVYILPQLKKKSMASSSEWNTVLKIATDDHSYNREKNKNFFQTLTKINGRHLYLKDTDEIQVGIHHSLMKCRQGRGGSTIIPGKRDCTWKKAWLQHTQWAVSELLWVSQLTHAGSNGTRGQCGELEPGCKEPNVKCRECMCQTGP